MNRGPNMLLFNQTFKNMLWSKDKLLRFCNFSQYRLTSQSHKVCCELAASLHVVAVLPGALTSKITGAGTQGGRSHLALSFSTQKAPVISCHSHWSEHVPCPWPKYKEELAFRRAQKLVTASCFCHSHLIINYVRGP